MKLLGNIENAPKRPVLNYFRARQAHRNGFTLIELLAVLAIIMILASLIVGVGTLAKQKARVARAEADIQLIHDVIEEYKIDVGIYPQLLTDVTNRLPERVDAVDPWGRDYIYQLRSENSYTLHSEGPDPGIPADNIPRR